MKTLVLFAGLPGVGKSHIARIIDKKLEHAHYFDSDLFAKESMAKQKIDFKDLTEEGVKKVRIQSQKDKIKKIKKLFKDVDLIFLDTCFDIPEARKLYYKIDARIIILEVICQSEIVKERILSNEHSDRQPGNSRQKRWEFHLEQKEKWTPIKWKNHFIINSEKNLNKQINKFIKEFEL